MEELYITEEKSVSAIYNFISRNEYLLPDPFSKHVNLIQYAEKLSSLGTTFVCKKNEEIVGLLSGYINDVEHKKAYVQISIVSKQIQGKGIGTRLYMSFIDKARNVFKSGVVFVTVDKCNDNAIRLYRHIGFTPSATIHANEQKLIMEYKL